MKIKNLASIATLALAALAAPFAARAAGSGDIYEIRPVDADGKAIAITEKLTPGSELRFVVRLMAPKVGGEPGNPFHLVHIPGLNSEAMDWILNRPSIGIFVNGQCIQAQLAVMPYLRAENLTDCVFTYTVRPGDFALPVRLATESKQMVTDSSSEVKYYVQFGNGYVPAWRIDDSAADGTGATREAVFQYGDTSRYVIMPPESDGRRTDYDLTGCNFNIQTIDFDKPSEPFTKGYWRTMPQGEVGCKDAVAPRLVVTCASIPTNAVKLYLWSEEERAVYLPAGTERDVHVTASSTEKRRVLTIDTVADYSRDLGGYEFQLAGADAGKGKPTRLVLSAFPDFNYTTGSLTPTRIKDYVSVDVLCGEPNSSKVTIKPGRTEITAKHDYKVYETELSVRFNKTFSQDVMVEIVPSFKDASWAAKTNWWEYIRLSELGNKNPELITHTSNPKVKIPAGSLYPTEWEDGTQIDNGKIYLYALRTDSHVTGDEYMTFAVKTDNAEAGKPASEGGIDGWNKPQSTLIINGEKPEIVEMFGGDYDQTATVGAPKSLQIEISDVYADMKSADGYEVWVLLNNDDSETTFKKVDGLFKPGKGNVLFKVGTTDELPKVTYQDDGDAIKSTVYVKAPVSGEQSANFNFRMKVTIPKGYSVETTTGLTEYNEGDTLQLKVTFDEKNKAGKIWAFLMPNDEASSNAVECTWLAEPGKASSYQMGEYDTELTGLNLKMIDGDGSSFGSTYTYTVVFCTQNTWDPAKQVTAYKARNVVQLQTHNVVPSIGTSKTSYVRMNNLPNKSVYTEKGVMPGVLPIKYRETFTAKVNEPGTADKTATGDKAFQVRWMFTDASGMTYGPNEAPLESTNPGVISGNPDKTSCTFDFPTAGRWTVTVELKDKDMDDFGNGEIGERFTFYVDVVSQPTVVVEAETGYRESDASDNGGEAKMDLVLQINECTFPLLINVKLDSNAPADSKAPGTFLLETGVNCELMPDGSYNVTVPARQTTVPLNIKAMDGTRDSFQYGFRVTPTVLTEDIVPNSGNKRACDYYQGVTTAKVQISNAEPVIEWIKPQPGTNEITTAIGTVDESRAIYWRFKDVDLDFARSAESSKTGKAGIKVEIKGDSQGFGPFWYTSYEEAENAGATGYRPKFEKSGRYEVTLIITDPDNGINAENSWIYVVTAAKSIQAVAHGPASGNGGSFGKRYRTAAGLGEGRIWADAQSDIAVKTHESTINCGMAKTYKIYAYGYKVNDIDDGKNLHYPDGTLGYYLDRDTPIDKDGGNLPSGETGYAYPDTVRDSFLYAWLQITRGEDGSSALTDAIMGEATAPEYWKVADSGATVGLPTEMDDDGNYDESVLEAIFSKEFLASDNMGDINADGIPDIYVDKYKFSVVDDGGTLSGDDLADVNFASGESAEPYCVDYLPNFVSSPYSALIPGLAESWVDLGRPFIPRLKIRGFDEEDELAKKNVTDKHNTVGASALNDAPELVKIKGVECDKVYTNPREDAKSTLNYVEWLAWCEFKAAWEAEHPGEEATPALWSPERPSDPTKPDTDGDGMSDGYEYYFWYLAHVGYIDANGQHRYLTGRVYDPSNPGQGKRLSSEKIAEIFDPLSPGSFSELTDTDNDGLPDLLEFEIGTNPIDFDTDGDGLPDGWEIMIAGLDPTTPASSADGFVDTERNYDGDAMAISSYKLEANVLPLPANPEHAKRVTFAIIAENGDTDGVQWYAMTSEPKLKETSKFEADTWWKVTAGDKTYFSEYEPVTVDGRLAAVTMVRKLETYTPPVEEAEPEPEEDTVSPKQEDEAPTEPQPVAVLGFPVLLEAGEPVTVEKGGEEVKVFCIADEIDKAQANACWIYGRGSADTLKGEVADSAAEYGCLALARQLAVPADAVVCAYPSDERDVAFLHFLCYQEFGFDPRTAWSADDPLAARWAKSAGGDAVGGVTQSKQGGYVQHPTRTRKYVAYDEFLVSSFFYNNEGGWPNMEVPSTAYDATMIGQYWAALTTNPQGPNEPDLINTENYFGRSSDQGADTDLDGVPDGWELYVMAGPKQDGAYVFAPPYDGFKTIGGGVALKNHWSPFRGEANQEETTNPQYVGAGNADELNLLREFSGTDCCAYYFANGYSTTILNREAQVANAGGIYTADDSKWLNKFFPTDPWNVDTDGDGLSDSVEGTATGSGQVIYGTPADSDETCSIPGGGYNPCTVDTDRDGLPDGWEYQFKGSCDSVYVTTEAGDFFKDKDGNPVGNPKQGLTDGMDGTVKDACNYPDNGVSNEGGYTAKVDRDYDHDGLENWQEYLVGTMRCWRYDDPVSPMTYIPEAMYFTTNAEGQVVFDAEYAAKTLKAAGYLETEEVGEFWYKTLIDASSPIYNPHFVTGTSSGAQYFSRVKNGWDLAYYDTKLSNGNYPAGAYYWFCDRIDDQSLSMVWGKKWIELGYSEMDILSGKVAVAPVKYPSCSPIDADSDHDGLDDYYELFHGMNPLLGQSGVAANWMLVGTRGAVPCNTEGFDVLYDALNGSCELIPQAWGEGKDSASFQNYWQQLVATEDYKGKKPRGTGFDFEVFPWLNGLAAADPDGDGTLNQEEAVMGQVAPLTAWHHSDPTPLWMTDSSYTNSLTRMFYRVPVRRSAIGVAEASFTYNEETYVFADIPGFADGGFAPFNPEMWKLVGKGDMGYMASFEENEGFDSDHDGLNDNDEVAGKFRGRTDSIDADSPRRRQAMYFQGKDRPSILQTMPTIKEEHPILGRKYPDDLSFLHYTVECWVKPESLDDSTIIERASWIGESNPGDREFLRCNFQLGIKNGNWYTKYDPNETTLKKVEVSSEIAATTDWTHLAATYDGSNLVLYVNGVAHGRQPSGLQPAYGSAAAWQHSPRGDIVESTGGFWTDSEYQLNAIIVGASAKTVADGATDGSALDVTKGKGWSGYTRFFKGYVDEIRIWDGVRSGLEILAAKDTRFTTEDALANRQAYYDVWSLGGAVDKYRGRYAKDEQGRSYKLPAELRYHWSFDSVFGATDEGLVAKAPQGFDYGFDDPERRDIKDRARLSRPENYEIAWWKTVLDGYDRTVYDNKAWVEWIPNTVAHLPRFDGTTLDSFYWSEDFMGATQGNYTFHRTAEPVSRWTQMKHNGMSGTEGGYSGESTRHYKIFAYDQANDTKKIPQYDFTGRHLNQSGDDLLPLGGAFVKQTEDLWDGQGATTSWEIGAGSVDSEDGIPAWWANYAFDVYEPEDGEDVTWDTWVTWPEDEEDGMRMRAGEAYLRDLARGYVSNDGGDYAVTDGSKGDFRQTYDANGNGLPDWWEELYNLGGAGALDDNDNDGLPNYVEYLLSEVFEFKSIRFSPVNPRSVDKFVPDYFYRVGELYAGEIFTDHDLVNDLWEDKFANTVASRLLWDAYEDPDQDGWSNRSEDRAGTDPSKFSHAGIEDSVIADYPIPMIHAKVTLPKAVSASVPIVIQAFTDDGFSLPDATWQTSTTAGSLAKTKAIGTNPGGTRHYYLSPGSISPGQVTVSFNDENAVTYYYQIIDGKSVLTKKVITGSGWYPVATDRMRTDGGVIGDIVKYDGSIVGWINYTTGEVELWFDDAELKSASFVGETGTAGSGDNAVSTEETTEMNLTRASVMLAWQSSLVSQGSCAEFYLSDADTGHIREGKNTFVAFADANGDGKFTPGEAYGTVRDVDISWSGTTLDIELTSVSPVTPRIQLAADSESEEGEGGSSGGKGEEEAGTAADRVRTISQIYQEIKESIYAKYVTQIALSNALANLNWMNTNVIADPEETTGENMRVRVVRWLVDGTPVWMCGVKPRVVFDKRIYCKRGAVLTEADFLADGALDLDWEYLQSEIVNADGVQVMELPVVKVDYLVVIGDGVTSFMGRNDTNNVVKALQQVVERRFGHTCQAPTIVSPSASAGQVVREAVPTFRWKNSEIDEAGFTTFRVEVADASGKVIYSSGDQLLPARDTEGCYNWQPPLFAGDKLASGVVYANNADYTWRVAMGNAKYRSGSFSASGTYKHAVALDSLAYGKAPVAVRYFGPTKSYEGKTIRVRAYTSPDFTGKPVASGYVAAPADESTGVAHGGEAVENCTLLGLPKGTYYLQAFIDSDGDGLCGKTESMGYLCDRSGESADWLTPIAVEFGDKVGTSDLSVIYIEDADTDGDSLPDAWELKSYNSLTAVGVSSAKVAAAGNFVVNSDLSGKLKVLAGKSYSGELAGEVLYTLGSSRTMAALMSGVEPSELDPEVTLNIAGFSFDSESSEVKIDFNADVEPGKEIANTIYTIRSGETLKLRVYHKNSLADDWTPVGDVKTLKVTAETVKDSFKVPMTGISQKSGFFTVRVVR